MRSLAGLRFSLSLDKVGISDEPGFMVWRGAPLGQQSNPLNNAIVETVKVGTLSENIWLSGVY